MCTSTYASEYKHKFMLNSKYTRLYIQLIHFFIDCRVDYLHIYVRAEEGIEIQSVVTPRLVAMATIEIDVFDTAYEGKYTDYRF